MLKGLMKLVKKSVSKLGNRRDKHGKKARANIAKTTGGKKTTSN